MKRCGFISGCAASTTRKVGGTKLTFRFQPGMACYIGQLGTGLAPCKGGQVTKVEYSIDGHHVKTVSTRPGTLKASFAVC